MGPFDSYLFAVVLAKIVLIVWCTPSDSSSQLTVATSEFSEVGLGSVVAVVKPMLLHIGPPLLIVLCLNLLFPPVLQ